jgi:hypothetical protein
MAELWTDDLLNAARFYVQHDVEIIISDVIVEAVVMDTAFTLIASQSVTFDWLKALVTKSTVHVIMHKWEIGV